MTERRIRESNGCDLGRRVRYERTEDEPPSIAVATALAHYRDEEVTAASTRLYDYIDPEALDALFAESGRSGARSADLVEFDVDEATVAVRPGRVDVFPAD
ncbi:HalOD1 output domain-containing protein [Halopiger djelfimassiliensis]|uniref:HalOD1 output domain-containing protein n=1 Tax=Halopiger djelfimassiliensis TaxID=1293047 RepID=UPI000677B958|nr:HalOD1 output domain-containing protein [Halopiger djelfimassiliensis]